MTTFTAVKYQNEYLPAGGSEVNAIVAVTSAGGGAPAEQPEAAEIVIVDTSGSMASPRTKIKAAREATAVAIDCIREGVAFAVISGRDGATVLYPDGNRLIPASDATRGQAKLAAERLKTGGGTAIGSWLTLARELFGTAPGRVCHAILLTDGENEHETDEQLGAALAACEGRFQCDCRGVGTDWKVSELRRIASTLLGTAEIIADPADMAQDFRSTIETAMGKATRSLALRVWTPQGARVESLRQVWPTIEDLTDRATSVSALEADYPTGSWGAEKREYHLCVEVQPHGVGDEMLASRVKLVDGDEALAKDVLVKAIWTDDQELSTHINPQVAHYTDQAELAACVQDGIEARQAGDLATATAKLGRAVQLAAETGNEGTMKLLAAVVDVDDAASGTVRLRGEVEKADEMALDTRSVRTVRARPTA